MHQHSFTKKALVLSVCLLIFWAILGTGTTIAWFTDTTDTVKNSLNIGELNLKVFYKNDCITDYMPVDSGTSIFNDQALYEPGYTQAVYLRVENHGEIDFNYKVSVDRYSYVDSINTLGGNLHLPQYLRFGVLFAADESTLKRDTARMIADKKMIDALRLNQYSQIDPVTVPVGGTRYVALVVYMPEGTGNEANYKRNAQVPTVELGLTVFAQQAGTPLP